MIIDFKSRKTWFWGGLGLLVLANMGNDGDSASLSAGGAGAARWRDMLAGTRLNYRQTYTSYSGGFSRSEQIDLCPQGGYTIYNQSSIDMGGPAADAGTWDVQENGGDMTLVLTSTGGQPVYLRLALDAEQNVVLGNKSYIPTKQGRHAPACY